MQLKDFVMSQKTTVKRDGKGDTPPKMQNYSIQVDLDETERRRYLEDAITSNDITQIGSASMTLEIDNEGDVPQSPFVDEEGRLTCKPIEMCDPLASRAVELLQKGTYPGDYADMSGNLVGNDPQRFLVFRTSNSKHVIMDRLSLKRLDPELTNTNCIIDESEILDRRVVFQVSW